MSDFGSRKKSHGSTAPVKADLPFPVRVPGTPPYPITPADINRVPRFQSRSREVTAIIERMRVLTTRQNYEIVLYALQRLSTSDLDRIRNREPPPTATHPPHNPRT